jgi:hypothetical protein
VNNRAALGLTAGALVVGLLAGLAVGGGDGGDKAAKAGRPGPTKIVAGVPVGYERSKAGAVRAGLAYQNALAGLANPKVAATPVINAIATQSDQRSISDAVMPGLEVIRKALGETGFVRAGSVGYLLKDYRSDSAVVVIWSVSVLNRAGSQSTESGWTTTTLRLRWADDDWKLAGPPDGSDGPTPALQGSPSEPGVLTSFVGSLEEVGDVPTD